MLFFQVIWNFRGHKPTPKIIYIFFRMVSILVKSYGHIFRGSNHYFSYKSLWNEQTLIFVDVKPVFSIQKLMKSINVDICQRQTIIFHSKDHKMNKLWYLSTSNQYFSFKNFGICQRQSIILYQKAHKMNKHWYLPTSNHYFFIKNSPNEQTLVSADVKSLLFIQKFTK